MIPIHSIQGMMRSICCRNSFFRVLACPSSSVSADNDLLIHASIIPYPTAPDPTPVLCDVALGCPLRILR